MDNEIVITGMSGRFPESDNVAEFSKQLYNKVNLVRHSSRRWKPGLHGLPKFLGQIKDISKFDAEFFGIHHKQTEKLDPQARILLETTYEAIVDAGYDPNELEGRNVGVFIGCSLSESLQYLTENTKKINGYEISGCFLSLLANRISYTFDFKGPSFAMDTACSSGAMALYEAVNAIRRNECEAAIVGGANLCLKPEISMGYQKLNVLSEDGCCKTFDVTANGFVRSEAIVTLFIQKAEVARRVYATILHIKSNTDGFKDQGFTYPSANTQDRLFREVVQECDINPLDISFVECHGTGTAIGDPVELSAVSSAYCFGREKPLLIGSVKSNMGHSEAASGLCGIVKVLIAMQSGLLPPNLHFSIPNPNIPSLIHGEVKVVSEPLPWDGKYAAVSSFGIGGVNVHMILKNNNSEDPGKNDQVINKFPRVVLYSSRTEEGVRTLFQYLAENPVSEEFFSLLHKPVLSSPKLKPFRGYKIIENGTDIVDIKRLTISKRPVWLIFPGMGTQWPSMGKELMNLKIFATTIRKLAKVLEPYNLDLIELLTCDEIKKHNENSIVPAFITIIAIQAALVDVLTELGIKPDGMIGHSLGEIGCAYADGCFTAEEMILSAYWRGKCTDDSDLIEGAMAVIGLTWNETKKICPDTVFPSCHNSRDSVTVSGPKEAVQKFLKDLKTKGVFAQEVNCHNYAYHSPHIFPMADKLQEAMESVIVNPKLRTAKWVSSSYPENEWDNPKSKLSDASYFVHNLVSPVLLYEALCYIPEDAVVIEIAPHHQLQGILKKVIGPKAEFIGLMERYANNSTYLLSAIGKMFLAGLNPDVQKLYPAVSFPASSCTPSISPLVKWDHSQSWTVAKWDNNRSVFPTIVEVDIGTAGSSDAFIADHIIDGRILYPATGYLMLAWDAFAEFNCKNVSECPVVFKDVRFHRATILSMERITKFSINILPTSGHFEISEGDMVVASGYITASEVKGEVKLVEYWKDDAASVKLNVNDIYKEMRLMGYEYGHSFQSVVQSNIKGNQGMVKWNGNWVVFLDAVLQFAILSFDRTLKLPVEVDSIKINPMFQRELAKATKDLGGIPVICDQRNRIFLAAGVEINGIKLSVTQHRLVNQIPLLEEYCFIPNYESDILSKSQKDEILSYVRSCSVVVIKSLELQQFGETKGNQFSNVSNKVKDLEQKDVSSHLCNINDDHVLLQCLKRMYNTRTTMEFGKLAKQTLTDYLESSHVDIFEKRISSEYPLRTILDVVLENTNLKNLNVFEVHDRKQPLSLKIHALLQRFYNIKANYTIACRNPDSLDDDTLELSNLKKINWPLETSERANVHHAHLLVLNKLNCNGNQLKEIMETLSGVLEKGNFLLVIQKTKLLHAETVLSVHSEVSIPVYSEEDLEEMFQDLKLSVIAKKSDGIALSMYLLRKPKDLSFAKHAVILIKTENHYDFVEQIKLKISNIQFNTDKNRIWLFAENDSFNGIIGLVNCLFKELGKSHIRCIFMDSGSDSPQLIVKSPGFKKVLQNDLTMNVFRKGAWGTFRHLSINMDKNDCYTEHAQLCMLTQGDLSSFKWIASPLKYYASSKIPNTLLCQVYYAPLNFRDLMFASGKLSFETMEGNSISEGSSFGLEFSGRDMKGERIMGIVPNNGIATTVAADLDFIWKVPSNWTLKEASTVPIAYCTAYYALIIRGNLRKGESILIHTGSSSVGQAAIAIAINLECKIFTSVGSDEKRKFLQEKFLELPDTCFCNSRDASFVKHINNLTNGKGVNVILNSLAGELLFASLKCIGCHGRFLEIGKVDFVKNTSLHMDIFLKNISFQSILVDMFLNNNVENIPIKREVTHLIKNGISKGVVKPLNCILFKHDQVEEAFRHMASGHHIGKIVLQIKEEEPERISLSAPVKLSVPRQTICNPKKSYIIIGGLGGFGLELCRWLVDRGAVDVILTTRSDIQTGYQHLLIDKLKRKSANIIVSKLNATNYGEAKELLKLASEKEPVGGIFNSALVLKDAFMENQSSENFRLVCEPKADVTRNLDTLSRMMCPELDWFVCFSSVSCGRGSAGQTNYGFANSVMERICEKRKDDGLPGLAIQWGAIGDVGFVQNTLNKDAVIDGAIPQRIASCLKVLDQFLQQDRPVVSCFVQHKSSEAISQDVPKHSILTSVGNIFAIKDMNSVNMDITLGELGLDSLMGVEVQQLLERHFDYTLPIAEIRQMKLRDFKEFKKERSDIAEGIDDAEQELEEITEMGSVLIKHLIPSETFRKLNDKTGDNPLFILHPIEGGTTMLITFAKMINCPVYGIEYTIEAPARSVEDLAIWYLNEIKILNISGSINIAGYSFGAIVALELAFQAQQNPESYPKIGSLVMLDGSPFLTAPLITNNKFLSTDNLQTEIRVMCFCKFVLQYINANLSQLKTHISELKTLDDQINYVATKISKICPYISKKDTGIAAKLYYERSLMMWRYTPKVKFKEDMYLLKACDSHYRDLPNISEQYGLENVCTGKVHVHTIPGNHTSFIERKSAIIMSNVLNSILNV